MSRPPEAGDGAPELLLLVGLTGAGKSTTLAAVTAARPGLRLLPNRRELADEVVIPEAQRLEGVRAVPVTDRLERFRLTARYRRAHDGGMAHALATVLAQHPAAADAATLVFDNLRGADEVAFAAARFPRARFVVLECDAATRVARLAGRADAFDRVAGAPTTPSGAPSAADLRARLAAVPGLAGLVDAGALASALAGLEPDAVETAARVVAEESAHYDPAAAWAVLAPLPPARRLRLDTGRMAPLAVAAAVRAWLDADGTVG